MCIYRIRNVLGAGQDVCGQDVAVAFLFDCKLFEYLAAISNSGQHLPLGQLDNMRSTTHQQQIEPLSQIKLNLKFFNF